MIIKNKNIQSIDLMKYIGSILIIANHTSSLYEISPSLNFVIINFLSRLVVPFFFIVAGYFFYKKIQSEEKPYKIYIVYIKRLLTIYIAWTIVYLPYDLIYPLVSTPTKTFENYLNIINGYLINFIYWGSHFHLWFFPALIISTTAIYIITIKKIKLKYLLGLALIFYSLGILGDAYFFLVANSPLEPLIKFLRSIFKENDTRLSQGLVFVSLGAWYAKKQIFIRSYTLLKILLISIFLFFIEVMILLYLQINYPYKNDYNMSIFLVPAAVSLFLFLQKFELKHKFDSLKYRQYSIIMYCFHIVPYIFYYTFIYGKFNLKYPHLFLFLFVLLSSHFFAAYLIRSKLPIKKYLY